MSSRIEKTTVLDGYYASGDYECFCFDQHDGPEEHREARGPEPEYGTPENDAYWDTMDDCRAYPDDLIPEGARGKRGKWTITVAFEAEA